MANIGHLAVELCLFEQLLSLFQSVAHCLLPSLLAANLSGLPALLTPFRRVSEAFLVKEFLLSTCPGEFLLTVNAGSCLVFKLAHFLLPFLLTPRGALVAVSAFGFGTGPGFGGVKSLRADSGTVQ